MSLQTAIDNAQTITDISGIFIQCFGDVAMGVISVMGERVTLEESYHSEGVGVGYSLYRAVVGGAGMVRVMDTEADRSADLWKFPEFSKAKAKYDQAVSSAKVDDAGDDLIKALEKKESFGTIDRLKRGVITKDQALAELAGDTSHIRLNQDGPDPYLYALELKQAGVDRKESWSKWIQKTSLKPGMDAKDWFRIYDDTQILESSGDNLTRMSPVEMAFSGQERMEFVLDSRSNYIDAMFRTDVGSISFLYGKAGKAPDFENGMGIANIIAKRDWANSHGESKGGSSKALLSDLVESIARGSVKREYGEMGFKQYDLSFQGLVATLLWHRGRQTFYLAGWRERPNGVLESAKIDREANKAAESPQNSLPKPTEKQKESGNYKKGHVSILGLDIAIENPAGSERSGVDRNGKAWTSKINHHYGYIKGTEGKDKDHLDVFLGPDPEKAEFVFVVNQVNPETGDFDEHKIMIGFSSGEEATAAYLSNYMKGWKGLGSMTEMSVDRFKEWLESGNTKKPVDGVVLEGALRETLIAVPSRICKWLKVTVGKVYADCSALQSKHPNQFKTPEDVKEHIEYVMANPHLEMEASNPLYSMVIRKNGQDKIAIIELKLKGGKHRIKSAYTLSEGQLEKKIKAVKVRGGRLSTNPANPTPRDLRSLIQGAGTPSDVPPHSQADPKITHITESVNENPSWKHAIQGAETFDDIEAVFRRVFPDAFEQAIDTKSDELLTFLQSNPEQAVLDAYQKANDEAIKRMDFDEVKRTAELYKKPPVPKVVYRGVSLEELKNIKETGTIKSNGSGNFDYENEQSLTFFTARPYEALSYADGFTMKGHEITPDKPGYVLELQSTPEMTRDMSKQVVTSEAVPAKNITRIIEIRPVSGQSPDRQYTEYQSIDDALDYTDLQPKEKEPDIESVLKEKEFFGTLDRLERGIITEEQAWNELAGDHSHQDLDINASKPDPYEFAAELKETGIDRQATYSKWVQRTGLNPGMDAKDWYRIYDSV